MVVQFANVNYDDRPVVILKTAGDAPIGVLGYAYDIECDIKYNETSELSFSLPYMVDGKKVPYYEDVIGMRTIELKGIGQFTTVNPEETGDGVQRIKHVKAYSLEYEFAYKKLSLEENTFLFWSGTNPEDTILGIIMERMPSWKVGRVSQQLMNKYRTFEVSNENLYNFIKNTVQQSYECIFDFDTMTRTVHVRSAEEDPSEKPVFIALNGLAKEIEVSEDTESIVTRLDVNGADDVDIRDVNPTGTNKLIDLSYYMNTTNFEQALIDKYFAWKELCEDYKDSFYNLSIQYTLKLAQKFAEEANLTDLKGEKTGLESLQAVIIQAMASGAKTQEDLDEINGQIAMKQDEIDAKQAEVDTLAADAESTMREIHDIRDRCSYEGYFTSDELLQMDRYMKDGDVSESSFVFNTTEDYTATGSGEKAAGRSVLVSGSTVSQVTEESGHELWVMNGGALDMPEVCGGTILTAILERNDGERVVGTFNLTRCTLGGKAVASACVTITGTASELNWTESEENAGSVSLSMADGYIYATEDTTEYKRRQVGFDLYEYGEKALHKLSRPTYTFSVESANFMALEDFVLFRNNLTMGERIYLQMEDGKVLTPICTGVRFNYDSPEELSLEFSDSYVAGESVFKLVDLLEQSVSSGKSVELGKYNYNAFVSSGAQATIKDFMQSALDTANNAITNSSGSQAVTWDGSGIRLRRWTDEERTAYDPEQMWIVNNSLLATDDGWQTAKMTVGKFTDENLGECWGIAAPMVVGTLVAGNQLVIESEKKDGGVATFRVDGDGVKLHNADFSLSSENGRQIILNADLGIAIGNSSLYTIDSETGKQIINKWNANFWVDADGNISITGQINTSGGTIGGLDGWTVGEGCFYSAGASALGTQGGIYIGVDGISVTDAVKVTANGSMIIRRRGEYVDNDTEDVSIGADDNYLMKIVRHPDSSLRKTDYTLELRNLRHTTSKADMEALLNVSTGEMCVVASSAEGSDYGLYVFSGNGWRLVGGVETE